MQIPVHSIDSTVLNRLITELHDKHHLDGTYGNWTKPILMFRLPPDLARQPGSEFQPLDVSPFAHIGSLGTFLGVRVLFTETRHVSHVAIPRTSSLFEQLRGVPFCAVFVRHTKPIGAFELSLPQGKEVDNIWEELSAN